MTFFTPLLSLLPSYFKETEITDYDEVRYLDSILISIANMNIPGRKCVILGGSTIDSKDRILKPRNLCNHYFYPKNLKSQLLERKKLVEAKPSTPENIKELHEISFNLKNCIDDTSRWYPFGGYYTNYITLIRMESGKSRPDSKYIIKYSWLTDLNFRMLQNEFLDTCRLDDHLINFLQIQNQTNGAIPRHGTVVTKLCNWSIKSLFYIMSKITTKKPSCSSHCLFLSGVPGCGKSDFGKILSKIFFICLDKAKTRTIDEYFTKSQNKKILETLLPSDNKSYEVLLDSFTEFVAVNISNINLINGFDPTNNTSITHLLPNFDETTGKQMVHIIIIDEFDKAIEESLKIKGYADTSLCRNIKSLLGMMDELSKSLNTIVIYTSNRSIKKMQSDFTKYYDDDLEKTKTILSPFFRKDRFHYIGTINTPSGITSLKIPIESTIEITDNSTVSI